MTRVATNADPVNSGRQPADPRFVLIDHALDFLYPAALRAIAQLGVADHLAKGPRPVSELAEATGADPRNLYRALRLLATRGVFAEDDAGRFALTAAAEPLRGDTPSSVRSAILMLTDRTFWWTAGELADTIRNGFSSFDRLFGKPFFDHFAQDAETAAIFHVGMASMSDPENPIIAGGYDFPATGTVVDVGGGHGGLLLEVLRNRPGLRGVLFDERHVLDGHRLGELGDDDRWELVAGDFFAQAPAGDIYLIKRILHDWDDGHSLRILRHCRAAMTDAGRVLVMDAVVPPGNDAHPSKVIDVLMMTALTGHERTRTQFDALFAEAGLRVSRIIPTGTPVSIVEGIPV